MWVASDLGQKDAVVNLDLTLDDEAGTPLPVAARRTSSAGYFSRPTPHGSRRHAGGRLQPPRHLLLDGSVALSTFDGADPNGTWQLWIMDDVGGDEGTISSWSLQITAEVDVQVSEQMQANAKKHKKQGKKSKR